MSYREQASEVGYAVKSVSAPPQPQSYIEGSIENIYSGLDRQERLLTSLEEKLYKVLGPDYPSKGDGAAQAADTSPLVNQLDDIYNGIRYRADRIASLIDRIQL